MATHSSILAWRIPGMGEPGGLPSMGSHRVGHDWSDLAAAAAAVVPCPVLTASSCPAYRFPKRQVRWSGIPISWRIFQFVVIHTVKGFGIINKTEADVFLELSCLFNDATDVGNLISGLPKSYIWIFDHYLLEHIFGGASEMLSPSNLDPSLCFIQPSISYDVLCI